MNVNHEAFNPYPFCGFNWHHYLYHICSISWFLFNFLGTRCVVTLFDRLFKRHFQTLGICSLSTFQSYYWFHFNDTFHFSLLQILQSKMGNHFICLCVYLLQSNDYWSNYFQKTCSRIYGAISAYAAFSRRVNISFFLLIFFQLPFKIIFKRFQLSEAA